MRNLLRIQQYPVNDTGKTRITGLAYIDGSKCFPEYSMLNYSPIIKAWALTAVSIVFCNVKLEVFIMRLFNQTLSIYVQHQHNCLFTKVTFTVRAIFWVDLRSGICPNYFYPQRKIFTFNCNLQFTQIYEKKAYGSRSFSRNFTLKSHETCHCFCALFSWTFFSLIRKKVMVRLRK